MLPSKGSRKSTRSKRACRRNQKNLSSAAATYTPSVEAMPRKKKIVGLPKHPRLFVHSVSNLGPEVAIYRDGIDRTLLRENLKLTPDERIEKHQRARRMAEELRRAGMRLRSGLRPAQ